MPRALYRNSQWAKIGFDLDPLAVLVSKDMDHADHTQDLRRVASEVGTEAMDLRVEFS